MSPAAADRPEPPRPPAPPAGTAAGPRRPIRRGREAIPVDPHGIQILGSRSRIAAGRDGSASVGQLVACRLQGQDAHSRIRGRLSQVEQAFPPRHPPGFGWRAKGAHQAGSPVSRNSVDHHQPDRGLVAIEHQRVWVPCPTRQDQQIRAFAGLDRAERGLPSQDPRRIPCGQSHNLPIRKVPPPSVLTSRAAFSSPRRFLLPVGDQSAPIPIRSPLALAAAIAAVPPYSARLLKGDQIIAPPWACKIRKSSALGRCNELPPAPG